MQKCAGALQNEGQTPCTSLDLYEPLKQLWSCTIPRLGFPMAWH